MTNLNIKNFYFTQYDSFPETLNRQLELDLTSDSLLKVILPRKVDLLNIYPFEETDYPPYFRNLLVDLNLNMIRLGKSCVKNPNFIFI